MNNNRKTKSFSENGSRAQDNNIPPAPNNKRREDRWGKQWVDAAEWVEKKNDSIYNSLSWKGKKLTDWYFRPRTRYV